jgi:excisionase family DNA binding protein
MHHRPTEATEGILAGMASPASGPRFLQLADVAETLNISSAQVYALVRSGELPAIKIGGRGQWRVEAVELENYIQRMYAETREFVSSHRFGRTEEPPPGVGDQGDEPA